MDEKAARRVVAAIAEHRRPAFAGDLKVMITPGAPGGRAGASQPTWPCQLAAQGRR